jgi:hypothetical protein
MKTMKKLPRVLLFTALALCVAALGALGLLSSCAALNIRALSKLSPDDAPGASYTGLMPGNEEIFGHVTALTSMGARVPGTQAHCEATEYLTKTLESFGLENVHTVESDTILWTTSNWGLEIGGIRLDSYYMTHSFNTGEPGAFTTPAGALQAEIVYVGKGGKSDFRNIDVRGKIVAADLVFGKVPIGLAKFAAHLYYDSGKTISLFSSKLNPYSANTYPYNYYNAMQNGAVGFIGILANYFDSNRYNNEDYS